MYSRICIFGRPGSGKSTFALKLHMSTRLPLYHLDRYFFIANWIERNYQEFLAIQKNIVEQELWIIDGNSLQSLEVRYARAQICLYFNYPRWLCLLRLIKRNFTKNPAIQDRAAGCPEKISWSLIKYMWTFESRLNQRLIYQISDLRSKYPHVQFIEVCNKRDLDEVQKLLSI
jgi:adenylate kinase family enzyme